MRWKTAVVIAIIAVAFFSSYLIAKKLISDRNKPYTYNGFTFEKEGPLWYTQVQVGKYLYRVPFHHLPSELENVSVSGTADRTFLSGEKVYITFNPLAEKSEMPYIFVAVFDLETNLLSYFGRTPEVACTFQDGNACLNHTIINCTNTTAPIIQIESEGNASVILRGNCIRLRGRGDELIKAAERFTLLYYGIMR